MNYSNHDGFPRLRTERLNFRPLTIHDADDIYFLRSDKKINEYLIRKQASCRQDALDFILMIQKNFSLNQWLYWALSLHSHSKLAGTICLFNIDAECTTAELGYELMPDYQGKGFMQEAVVQVLDYGFSQLELHSITATVHVDNTKSIRLLEKNGFQGTTTYSSLTKDYLLFYQLDAMTYLSSRLK